MKALKGLDNAIDTVVTRVLIVCVMTMLMLSVSNIVLRWFNAHVMWIEPMVRYMVVICAFCGGAIATGKRSHIAIDVIGKYLESQKKERAYMMVTRFTDLFCVIALGFLTYACVNFVHEEAEYGKVIFLGIHAKYLAMILPAGFGLMATRFLLHFFLSFFPKESA